MDGGQERRGVFGIARGNAASAFQTQKGILDQMPLTVNVLVVITRNFAVLFRRDRCCHLRLSRLRDDRIRVVAAIGQ